jgi:formylglycine-generating enzyme
MMTVSRALFVFLLVTLGGTAHAVVTFNWATVGNPGNAGDVQPNGTFGAVDYVYRISKHEVTNSQYSEFLNAVDPMGTNPNSVYSTMMALEPRSGIAFNAGAASGSKYSSKTNMGNKPVNYVSFFDAMRFTNWLENGQPTGGGGTETGVYTIGNGLDETRAPRATFFIPSEHEWYKAAYYQPAAQGGDTDNYWLYPTASNSEPTIATANAVGDISNPGANVANYGRGAGWNGQNGNVTTVGSAGPLSASFYGTFDQGGNVWEWNEAVISSSFRGLRGGSWNDVSVFSNLAASVRSDHFPTYENFNIGFRVASNPAPLLSCDFNSDSSCNIDDLNAMLSQGPIAPDVIVTPGVNNEFDLTGDGLINNTDADRWLADAATVNGYGSPYKRGDANLDGIVDVRDFNRWNSHKFTSTLLWDDGNFNGDAEVDGSDFGIWNGNKFTSSDGASVIPEPSTGLWGLIAAIGRLRRRRMNI